MQKIEVCEVYVDGDSLRVCHKWISLYLFQVKELIRMKGSNTQCILVLDDKSELVIEENFEELFIRINDLQNGDVEGV